MRTDIDEFDDGADRPKRVDPADERYVAQQKPAQWNNTDDIDELDRIEYTIDVDELDDIDPARLPTSAWVQPTVPKSHTKVWKSTKKVGAKLKKSLKKANQSLSTSKRRSSRFLLATILAVLSAAMLVAQVVNTAVTVQHFDYYFESPLMELFAVLLGLAACFGAFANKAEMAGHLHQMLLQLAVLELLVIGDNCGKVFFFSGYWLASASSSSSGGGEFTIGALEGVVMGTYACKMVLALSASCVSGVMLLHLRRAMNAKRDPTVDTPVPNMPSLRHTAMTSLRAIGIAIILLQVSTTIVTVAHYEYYTNPWANLVTGVLAFQVANLTMTNSEGLQACAVTSVAVTLVGCVTQTVYFIYYHLAYFSPEVFRNVARLAALGTIDVLVLGLCFILSICGLVAFVATALIIIDFGAPASSKKAPANALQAKKSQKSKAKAKGKTTKN